MTLIEEPTAGDDEILTVEAQRFPMPPALSITLPDHTHDEVRMFIRNLDGVSNRNDSLTIERFHDNPPPSPDGERTFFITTGAGVPVAAVHFTPGSEICSPCDGDGLVGVDDAIIECPTCDGRGRHEVQS